MRTPTPLPDQLRYHTAAIAGENPPRFDGVPECGWYKRRMVRGGPFLPVRIWLEQHVDTETGELAADEVMHAECLGQAVDPKVYWTYCTPITRDEYHALVKIHRDEEVMAATHVPVDLSQTPIGPRSPAR